MKAFTRLALLATGLLTLAAPVLAQEPGTDLSQLSIEDLMSIEITSASRREQRTADVAAAVFVITQDDIRRSGMTTVPDLLRMAPGVDVAQHNSNNWAVSVRGFNGVYANKLLILVDGRSLYNRIFSGTNWDAEDLMIDDIDRIEVIRGPGAAMWGANAVNGVINIVTKSTADTKGGLVRVEAGRADEQGALRYGGTLGAATYRLFSQWTRRNESLIVPGTGADDASHSVTTGFRADVTTRPGAFLFEGGLTAGRARALWPNFNPETYEREPVDGGSSRTWNGYLLGRWTHLRPGGASLQVQSFVDLADRDETFARYGRQTFNVDTQYHTALGAHHDVVAGGGYRFSSDRYSGRAGFLLIPARDRSTLLTAFVQDEIALFGSRLAVTLGTQVQHDSLSGTTGVQPTARVMWKAIPRQRFWAATSRALRTPSRYEQGLYLELPPEPGPFGLPLLATVIGNPDMRTETLVDAEAGYRVEIGSKASLDVTGFTGRYEHLRTIEAGAPVIEFAPSPRVMVLTQFGNQLGATTRGLEIAGHWVPGWSLRVDGSYTAFHVTPRLAPTSLDAIAATEDGSTPRHQWQLRSSYAPAPGALLTVAMFRVGRLEQALVDGYIRTDINAEWGLTKRLSVMAIGQNIFQAAHPEFASGTGSLLIATQVPRSASLRLRWSFQ
jgi:iron complex outermembrane receptor protein